ncbi:MAG: hypothetical protein QOF63_1753 [Thermoanaerobaculia bacterium]|nr:hypothetical protein [Thermoanaerobaculia bacterium]
MRIRRRGARRVPIVLLFVSLGVFSAASAAADDDALTIGSAGATAGSVAKIPVYIRDAHGTPLGMDQSARIQTIQFTATFTNPAFVAGCTGGRFPNCQMTFLPDGVLASLTPSTVAISSGVNFISVKLIYDRVSHPAIQYTLDAPEPGNLIGYIELVVDAKAPPGAGIAFTIVTDSDLTSLSDSASGVTASEKVGSGLTVRGGKLAVSDCTTSPDTAPLAIKWSGACETPAATCPAAGQIAFSAASTDDRYTYRDCDDVTWNFGDGGKASGLTASHTYAGPGTFKVQMTVTNPAGTQTVEKIFTIICDCFTSVPSSWDLFIPLTFSSFAPGCGIASVQWKFSGGPSLTGTTVTKVFSTAGLYSWEMTLFFASGGPPCVRNGTIFVSGVVGQPQEGAPCSCEIFVASSSFAAKAVNFFPLNPTCSQYTWNFGDGSPVSNTSSVSHVYTQAGTYTWSVTVTAPLFTSCSASRTIVIAPPPRRRSIGPH